MSRFRDWPLSKVNLALKLAADALLLSAAFAAAFWIRFDGRVPPRMWEVCRVALPWIVILKTVLFYFSGLYRSFWRYSGINDLKRLLLAQAGGMAAGLFVVTMSREATFGFPRGIYFIDAFLCLILAGGLRFVPRWLREVYPPTGTPRLLWSLPGWIHTTNTKGRRALLVGAGDGGEMILRETRKNPQSEICPIGFVDDDPRKQGREIHGVPVLGTQRDIPRLVEELGVEEILLTLPSASGREIQAILRSCSKLKTRLRIVPKLSEIVSGSARLTDIRDLRLEDLLRREKVNLNLDQISGSLRGKRILVTGAGGSIGSELCRQIAAFEPRELLLFGRGENSIFVVAQELATTFPGVPRKQIIGDVINRRKLEGVFEAHRPEIVFHAGADKHVPLMEMNPDEAVLNNIFGTRNVLEVCESFGVEKLVCVSTDKAVNPMSVMGCCKRVAEMLVQSRPWGTPSVVVRFGNVLGSRGSVVPTFYEQIRRGGPVTVTHPDMTRYFMTIPEAAQLVVQASALGKGGEIFVLDMGDQLRIADLAREMIQLSGLSPENDIQIQFVGIRPGEKLYEELAAPDEKLGATAHPKILRIQGNGTMPGDLDRHLKELYEAAIRMDSDGILAILSRLLPSYRPFRKPVIDTQEVRDHHGDGLLRASLRGSER